MTRLMTVALLAGLLGAPALAPAQYVDPNQGGYYNYAPRGGWWGSGNQSQSQSYSYGGTYSYGGGRAVAEANNYGGYYQASPYSGTYSADYYGGYSRGGGTYEDNAEDSPNYARESSAYAYYINLGKQPTSEDQYVDADTPIELWLSRGVGRYGPHRFEMLGGRSNKPTPIGTFTVQRKAEDYFSRKYKAPMPLAQFFTAECALHVGSLETPSRGCVHLDWDTAGLMWRNTRTGRTKVIIHP